jgi:hypothetical protein
VRFSAVHSHESLFLSLWRYRYRLLHSHPIEFAGVGGVPIMDRDNVAQIIVLEDTAPTPSGRTSAQRSIVVANTHLLFNPKRGDVKLCQLHHLTCTIAAVQRLVQAQRSDCPLPAALVVGDFNRYYGAHAPARTVTPTDNLPVHTRTQILVTRVPEAALNVNRPTCMHFKQTWLARYRYVFLVYYYLNPCLVRS